MNHAGQFDLTDKVAVVTGGSRGLGRAIAQAFAEAGGDVVIASRKLDSCESAAEQIAQATGRRAIPVACHVGRWDDCDALIDATLEEFGRIDVLVNNAGMSPLYDELVNVSEELYDKTLAVNLKGPFRLGVLAGHAHGEARRRRHHQRRDGRLSDGQPERTAVRMREGRAERPHRRTGRRFCAVGASQCDLARTVRHRCHPGMVRGNEVGQLRSAGTPRPASRDRRCCAVSRKRRVQLHDGFDDPCRRRGDPAYRRLSSSRVRPGIHGLVAAAGRLMHAD